MQKVLIIDSTKEYTILLNKFLGEEFHVKGCQNAEKALQLLAEFEPDIVVLDVNMSNFQGISILQFIQSSGRNPFVVALTSLVNERMIMRLKQYDIFVILNRCCYPEVVAWHVRQAAYMIANPDAEEWSLALQVDMLLISLGFRPGGKQFLYTSCALQERYRKPTCAMKELYIDVGNRCEKSPGCVEKSIRDGIQNALMLGNKYVWAYYFVMKPDGGKPFRGTEGFLSRLVVALKNRPNVPTAVEIEETMSYT